MKLARLRTVTLLCECPIASSYSANMSPTLRITFDQGKEENIP
jgi:hypothetical protein